MMSIWVVILGFTVALVLLQVLVYRYLWSRGDSLPDAGRTRGREFDGRRDPDRPARGDDRGRRERPRDAADVPTSAWRGPTPASPRNDHLCPHCGTENEPDPAYTFCRNCAGRLG